MPGNQRSRHGYLLLADISGYTAFLTGTELEHAHGIVNELTTLIRARLTPPMRFVKLEGDAAFCYAEADSFKDGERLVELLEACYFAFSNRLQDMTRSTTCRCDACAAIGSLDLKFVTHYGSFMVERDGDREDLAGPDVILVHRLLKNNVGEDGGPAAYAFLTEACLERMPEGFHLPAHTEVYESFGETTGGVHDLGPVLEQMRAAQREYISSAEADFELSGEHPYPAAVLWQYFVDPEKRLRWQPLQTAIRNEANQHGRMGPGASSHCAHGVGGDAVREYLDWRPFTYFTNRMTPLTSWPAFFATVETTEFIPTDTGTTMVHYRVRLRDRGRLTRLRFRSMMAMYRRALIRSHEKLEKAMHEDGCLDARRSPGVEATQASSSTSS